MPSDIIFVLGPAGVGRSELSSAVAQNLDVEKEPFPEAHKPAGDTHDCRELAT